MGTGRNPVSILLSKGKTLKPYLLLATLPRSAKRNPRSAQAKNILFRRFVSCRIGTEILWSLTAPPIYRKPAVSCKSRPENPEPFQCSKDQHTNHHECTDQDRCQEFLIFGVHSDTKLNSAGPSVTSLYSTLGKSPSILPAHCSNVS
jgi:hypothetical protein